MRSGCVDAPEIIALGRINDLLTLR